MKLKNSGTVIYAPPFYIPNINMAQALLHSMCLFESEIAQIKWRIKKLSYYWTIFFYRNVNFSRDKRWQWFSNDIRRNSHENHTSCTKFSNSRLQLNGTLWNSSRELASYIATIYCCRFRYRLFQIIKME